jgi:NAD(P)-dependent dehydrogenase (short-subunit alcohol dehydrogenase family)
MSESALIVGVGDGLSAALARLLRREGFSLGLASRHSEKLSALAAETGAKRYACDVADRPSVERLFAAVDRDLGTPDLVVFNPSYRTRGSFVELDPDEVMKSLMVAAWGGFLVAQAAARRMIAAGRGTLLLTGASASVKGYARSAPFAMAKFALRGMAQSLARELQPQNIHVGHIVIDGAIARGPSDAAAAGGKPDSLLLPEAIAAAYLTLHRQQRSAWSWEIELRPWTETF